MLTELPAEIMPAVEWLRKNVKPPEDRRVHVSYRQGAHCIFTATQCCPFGLIPSLANQHPWPLNESIRRVTGLSFGHINAFTADWWDKLPVLEARAAVDLIWPVEGAAK